MCHGLVREVAGNGNRYALAATCSATRAAIGHVLRDKKKRKKESSETRLTIRLIDSRASNGKIGDNRVYRSNSICIGIIVNIYD